MVVVIFEVFLKAGKQEDYLKAAAGLRQHLTEMEGFISVERFASLHHEGKLCSISFWRDEEAVARWREFELHAFAQQEGIEEMFENYRIRVGKIIRDYGMK